MMATNDLTADLLRSRLAYDAETGAFTWVSHRVPSKIGAVAGTKTRIGYLVVRLFGRLHYLHRLAYLHVTGEWPKETVDHIDGNKSNNRWRNLRDVPHAVNSANHHKAQGASGMLGAARNSRTGNWRAIITRDDKQIHIGTFKTPQEAHEAYMNARKSLD